MSPQSSFGGGISDIVIAKLPVTGSSIAWSTYMGGDGLGGPEQGPANIYSGGLDVGSDGSVWFGGWANSPDFPTMDATQPAFGGGNSEAIIVRLYNL